MYRKINYVYGENINEPSSNFLMKCIRIGLVYNDILGKNYQPFGLKFKI